MMMNVSKCVIRRGLQSSVACAQALQHPHLKKSLGREAFSSSSSRLLVLLQAHRGICITLASTNGCNRRSGGRAGVTNFSVVHGEAAASTRIRCATSGGAEVAESLVSSKQARRLILYSKPGCCLCDGLKEKLSSLPNIELEIRDILTRAEWENAYRYEIPVLAHIREDGSEEMIPRLSPRLSAEQMHKKLEAIIG